MQRFLHSFALTLFHLGGPGLFLVGIADSSFLFVPLANDLLVIALTAGHPHRMPYFAAMAALGSTAGCLILDVLSRKAESGISRKAKSASKRVKFVEAHIRKHAAWALAIAALVPPPFPFTPFVAAAAASGYPRSKLLTVIAGSRFVRFGSEGALAIFLGRRILSLAQSAALQDAVIALILIAVGGSGYSIFRWAQSPKPSHRNPQTVH